MAKETKVNAKGNIALSEWTDNDNDENSNDMFSFALFQQRCIVMPDTPYDVKYCNCICVSRERIPKLSFVFINMRARVCMSAGFVQALSDLKSSFINISNET